MENFLFAFNTVLPFLLYIAFGYGVRMSGLADEDFMKRLNKVIFQAFFPILMFNNLKQVCFPLLSSGTLKTLKLNAEILNCFLCTHVAGVIVALIT